MKLSSAVGACLLAAHPKAVAQARPRRQTSEAARTTRRRF
jgi:hypothetical protein